MIHLYFRILRAKVGTHPTHACTNEVKNGWGIKFDCYKTCGAKVTEVCNEKRNEKKSYHMLVRIALIKSAFRNYVKEEEDEEEEKDVDMFFPE